MRRVRGPSFRFAPPRAAAVGERLGAGRRVTLFAIWAFALSVARSPALADDGEALKAEGPYFAVAGDPSLDALPLKSTKVDVRLAGVIADVTVTQRYTNEGQPHRGALRLPGFDARRGACDAGGLAAARCTAQIEEKQRARIRHETARRGQDPALLEQERPNVFQMNVANILPGDDVQVELHYTELVVPTEGRYEFVFPPWSAALPPARAPAAEQIPRPPRI